MSKQIQQPQQVFVLMHTTTKVHTAQGTNTRTKVITHEPVGVYLDKEMALYDSWLLTEETYYSRNENNTEQYEYAPADYWVKDSYQVTERFNSLVAEEA